MRLGLIGVDSSHAEDFLRHFNAEHRYPGITITTLWGNDRDRVDALRRLDPTLVAAESAAALVEQVDAAIVGARHGDLHRAPAVLALAAGRPVFVDKPLANSLADARAIVAAAEGNGTPLLSASALRWQSETLRLKAKLGGLDGPIELLAYGTWYPHNEYGGAIYYGIHIVELVQELLGIEWRKLSLVSGDPARVRYKTQEHRVTLEFRPLVDGQSSDFGVVVRAGGIAFQQSIPLGDDYMLPVADQIAAMLRSRRSRMTSAELLAPIALMEEIEAMLGVSA
jgi:predicted dehydrogenase